MSIYVESGWPAGHPPPPHRGPGDECAARRRRLVIARHRGQWGSVAVVLFAIFDKRGVAGPDEITTSTLNPTPTF